MATNLSSLTVFLGLDGKKFNRGIGKAMKSLRKFSTGFAALAGTGATIALGAAARSFVNLNNSMTKSLAIMGDVNEEMRNQLQKTAREMSQQTIFSASQLADAYFFLSSAGKDVVQSQRLLGDVARFAQAGQFDLSTATTLLADAQSALGLKSKNLMQDQKNLIRVSDVLVRANTLANATVQEFSEALTNKAGPALKFVNKEIEEGVAVLAAFADQGIKGSEAGTALNIVMRELETKSLKASKAWDELRLSVFDVSGDMKNMATIISGLENKLNGMSDAQKKLSLLQLGFSDKSAVFIQSILGSADAIAKYEKQLRSASGTTKDVAEKQLDSFSAQWKILTSNMNEAIAVMLNFKDGSKGLIGLMKQFNTTIRNNTVLIGFWAKTLVLETEFAFKKIGKLLQFDNIALTFNWILDNWGKLWMSAGDILVAALKDFGNLWLAGVKNWFLIITSPIRATVEVWKNAFKEIWEFVKSGGKKTFNDAFKDIVSNAFKGVTDPIKNNFVDALSGLGSETEKALKKAGISELKFTGVTEGLLELDAELEARRKKLFTDTLSAVGAIAKGGLGAAGLGAGLGAAGAAQAPTKARIESSVVGAVQKGTIEALKLENQRLTKDDKIINNTGKTANIASKILKATNKVVKELASGGNFETVDVFSGAV